MTRRLGTLLVWTVLGALGATLLAVAAPYAAGGRSYTVMSGSMEPRIHTGDVVAEQRISASRMRSGDIVTFQDPDDPRRLITHRVRSVRERDGVLSVVTKGDANNTVERWTIPASAHLGRVRYRVARVGYALAFTRRPEGRIALVVIPALLLGMLELLRIWRREPEEARA